MSKSNGRPQRGCGGLGAKGPSSLDYLAGRAYHAGFGRERAHSKKSEARLRVTGPLTNTGTAPSRRSANALMNTKGLDCSTH
jgi:hypothetical protein